MDILNKSVKILNKSINKKVKHGFNCFVSYRKKMIWRWRDSSQSPLIRMSSVGQWKRPKPLKGGSSVFTLISRRREEHS